MHQHLLRGNQVWVLSRKQWSDEACAPDSVRWYQGDLRSSNELETFLEDVNILYQCVGEVRYSSCMREVHVEGTARLIAAAKGMVKRWVQLSSVGAYGKIADGIVTEETQLNPSGINNVTNVESEYLVSKADMEEAFNTLYFARLMFMA